MQSPPVMLVSEMGQPHMTASHGTLSGWALGRAQEV